MLTQHGQLRHAIIVKVIAIDKERVSLFHPYVAKSLYRVALLKEIGRITVHQHPLMTQLDRTYQHLHIWTCLLVGLRLIGM